ncbi:MAG: HD-GYP domain-containing protein [Dehalococcoidia bacterium]|nr:HD-GYP domain-containing protein [Dehalococcoidia bacterium]
MGVKQEDKEVIPAWLTWSLACIAGLALLLAGGSFLLRRQVIHRTQALTAEIIYREQAEEDLQKTLNDTVLAMAKILEMKDPYTSGHQVRVAELATAIAAKLNFSDEQIKYINTSAIIHDIGKMHIPSDILSKPGQLSDLEYKIIQTHAQGGYEILKGIEFPAPVAQTVLQHHERIDGSGYPHGLKGEDILLEARILAVADVVEAMSSYRPYRAALGVERALAEIKAKRGVLYDEKVVDACLELFNVDKFSFSTDA